MRNPFEYLDEIIGLLAEDDFPFVDDSRFDLHYFVYDENPFEEIYLGDLHPGSEIEIECVREINEYFDRKDAENNSPYGAILNRMHQINVKFDTYNLIKKKEALIKFYYENQNQFSKSGYDIIKTIEAAENALKHIDIRFNLLNINIYDLKNAVDEAYIEIDIEKATETVLFLERLGIFDFLRKELSGISNNQLGVIFGKVTKTKPGSISKAIGRLSDKTANTNAEEKIDKLIKKLKLPIKGK
jgi:hypothetical protein